MNARFVALIALLSLVAMTGCTGFGDCMFGRGAPCGPACAATTAPVYDYVPQSYADECGCGTDAYIGHSPGIIDNGYVGGGYVGDMNSYNNYGNNYSYQDDGWQATQGVPQPGTMVDGGVVVPSGPNTNMVPTPQLPPPTNQ